MIPNKSTEHLPRIKTLLYTGSLNLIYNEEPMRLLTRFYSRSNFKIRSVR